jgi:LCP family protein required for cell wall assembly
MLAAFASAIVPGIGQFIVGDRRKGTILLAISAGIILGLRLYFGNPLADETQIAKLWFQLDHLALMMIGNIVLFAYRIWAADDAYRTGKRNDPTAASVTSRDWIIAIALSVAFFTFAATTSATNAIKALGVLMVVGLIVVGIAQLAKGAYSARLLVAVPVVLLALLVPLLIVPHTVFGYYDVVQYDLLSSVFRTSSPTTTSPPVTTPPVTTADGSTVATTPTTAPPVTTTTSPWTDQDRLNILLIGGDFGEGRTGIRTDTMIAVSIDPVSGDTAMFSVPRNWTHVPLPEGMGQWDCGYNCYPELINELWVAGERYPESFPGPGTPPENAVKGVISEFLGIPIHHYAMVNLVGFVDVVDALGGVEVYVPSPVFDAEYPSEDGQGTEVIDIKTGLNDFDGHLALAYARSRHQDSDYFRMNRQRCVIEAMVEQADPSAILDNFQTLANVIKDTVQTDIPLELLPTLIDLKPVIDLENLVSIRFIPPDYHLKFRDDGKPGRVPNIELIHEHVDLVITDPARAVQELGLERLEDVCGAPAG